MSALISIERLRKFYGERLQFDIERFSLDAGRAYVLTGVNGAGKSTLLRILAGLESAEADGVLFNAQRAALSPYPALLRAAVVYVHQHPVMFSTSVAANIGYGLRARGVRGTALARAVEETAERTGVATFLSRSRGELSDGEVQRVAVARALAVRPEVLLLDEPASSADRAAARTLLDVLDRERRERGLTVCFSSHQLEDAYRWADDIRALADGRLSPVTPENLFRVTLPSESADGVKHVCVGQTRLAVLTDRTGPAILAVPPTDILVSIEPLASSARNALTGHVTRVAGPRAGDGAVHVTADVGVELTAVVTEAAARELALVPGRPVVLAFKASAVRVV